MKQSPLDGRQICFSHWVLALGFLFTLRASGAQLTLENYLQQVRGQNGAAKASAKSSEAARLTMSDSILMTKPNVFFNFNLSDDKRPTSSPLLGDETVSRNYQLGVQELTNFGLTGRLYYQMTELTIYNELPIGGLGYFTQPQSTVASPVIELTQSFWKNGFGSTTQANQELSAASSQANEFASNFKLKSKLLEAELSYYRLAIARQTIKLEKDLVDLSKKMVDWSNRRVRYNLGDRADMYQAQAGMQARTLELQSSQDEERSASRALNMTRGLDSDQVDEEILPLNTDNILKFEVPERAAVRDDVKAADQQRRVAQATALVASEGTKPNLDVSFSYSFNSLNTQTSDAVRDSFNGTHPWLKFGVAFSAPLDFENVGKSQDGHIAEKVAAALNYEQTAFESEQNWKDLRKKFEEGRRRLELSEELVKLQKTKLDYERNRLLRGRTTAFQVLQFEQDYATAELARLNSGNQVLQLEAQMKLYKGE